PASTPRISPTPPPALVAHRPLSDPYRGPSTSRSPTANGTAVAGGAGVVAVAVSDADAAGAARVESVPPVSDWARSEVAITSTATAVWAAWMIARARHAWSSWRHGLTRDGRCTRS